MTIGHFIRSWGLVIAINLIAYGVLVLAVFIILLVLGKP